MPEFYQSCSKTPNNVYYRAMLEVRSWWGKAEQPWINLPQYLRVSLVMFSLLVEAGLIGTAGIVGMAIAKTSELTAKWDYSLGLQLDLGQVRLNLISESRNGVKNCAFRGCPPKRIMVVQPITTIYRNRIIEWGGYPSVDEGLNWP